MTSCNTIIINTVFVGTRNFDELSRTECVKGVYNSHKNELFN